SAAVPVANNVIRLLSTIKPPLASSLARVRVSLGPNLVMDSLSVMPSSMGTDGYVLVDYDNLLPLFQILPLASLAHRISGTLDKLSPGLKDVHIRLYGGWYSDIGITNNGTRIAQEALKLPLNIGYQGKM